jgi:hypothetical protein
MISDFGLRISDCGLRIADLPSVDSPLLRFRLHLVNLFAKSIQAGSLRSVADYLR